MLYMQQFVLKYWLLEALYFLRGPQGHIYTVRTHTYSSKCRDGWASSTRIRAISVSTYESWDLFMQQFVLQVYLCRRYATDLIHGDGCRGWRLVHISWVFFLLSSLYHRIHAHGSPQLPYRNSSRCRMSEWYIMFKLWFTSDSTCAEYSWCHST